MKVSIITVCFNSASTIRDTIESVIRQTYPDIEYLIVDGGSKDGTKDVIQSYSSDAFRFVSEPDKGIYDAMNKGVAASAGDIVTFLNSDDVFADTRVVEDAVTLFERNDHLGVTFGDVQFFSSGKLVRHYSSKAFKPWKLRFGWMPPHPGSFARADLFKKFGLFKTDYRIAADYEMFVRWLLLGRVKYERLDSVLVNMAVGGVSTESLSARLTLNKEIVRACRSNGVYTNLLLVLLKIPFKLLELKVPG